jgi:hypothetical protein
LFDMVLSLTKFPSVVLLWKCCILFPRIPVNATTTSDLRKRNF